MKVIDNYSEDVRADLHKKLDEFFENNRGGFIILFNGEQNKITDLYWGVCDECVMGVVASTLAEAKVVGLLAEHGKETPHASH